MRRDIQSTKQFLNQAIDDRLVEKTRIAYLAADFVGASRQVYVQFSDPLFTRGSSVKANLAAGLDLSSLGVGTPVTVLIRRGQVQVVGIPLQSGSTTATGIERVYAHISAAQSIANNTNAPILFDTNDLITEAAFHDTSNNTNQFVAPFDGVYHVSGWARFGTFSAAGRVLLLLRNSSAVNINGQRVDVVTTGTGVFLNVATDIELVTDDWVEWVVFQVTAAAQSLSEAKASMRYIGA